MIELPASTMFGRRIPKQKFYENLPVTPALRRVFIEQISSIIWRNKIAASTANIAQGVMVDEVQVFEIQLTAPELDQAVLRLIDRGIPYRILFILICEGHAQAWIGYKEVSSSNGTSRVTAYYHTDWMPEEQLSLKMEGGSTDAVYEGFVRQIAGDALQSFSVNGTMSLGEAVANARRREKLQKQIDALQKKVDREKQFNRRVVMNEQLKQLIRERDIHEKA